MTAMFKRRTLLQLGTIGLAAPFVRPSWAQSRQVTLSAYSGIFEDNYKAAVVDPFAASTGIAVNYVGMPTSAQMLGTLRAQKEAPQLDVVIMDVVVAKAGGDEGLYRPVSAGDLPVIDQLVPAARIAEVPGPAVTFDSFVLLYSPQRFATPPTSWRELWNPEHRGRISLAAPPDTLGVCLTLIADRLAGGEDYTQSVEKGIALLGEMAPLVESWDPKPDVFSTVVSGAADLSAGWNARGQKFSLQTPDRLAVAIPEDGSLFQINTINLVEGAAHTDEALEFMAYALSAETQARFTEQMYYGSTNAEANPAPEAVARTVPTSHERLIQVDWLKVANLRDGITEQWRRNVISRG